MTNILIVNSSALGDGSTSRQLTRELAARAKASDQSFAIVERDVGSNPPPHLLPQTVAGVRAVAETEAEQAALALSDELVAELQAADVVVIGAPMYNFGIPSTLKAWFDHVLRPRVTFSYASGAPEGLLTGKRAVVIETRGGFYSAGPGQAFDAQEPHLRAMLGFIGITDVRFVRAENLGLPDGREAAIEAALADIETFVRGELKAAA